MSLRLTDNTVVTARIKGKRLQPVCGDQVGAEPIPGETDWLITEIHERSNALTRPNLRGQAEVLAANVELLIVVSAPEPSPDWFIVDRYLSAAENMAIPSAVVFNKIDLDNDDNNTAALSDYEAIGFDVVRCSAETSIGIDEVQAIIAGSTAIIVGQSGVGKSSIINRLLGGEQQRTAEISAKTGEGRHTTVNSVMLDLPGGGRVIDSPGVRDYAPALESSQQVIKGFREIAAAGSECRFADCRHLREPGCEVKARVTDETISARRYESYRRLLALTEQMDRQY